jgi:CRISPR/Cas system endoribonuclease Cas6 (RAMP superfamily)
MKMNFGGFVGDVGYRGDLINQFLPLLISGELLHIGTATSFGLGKYQIET